MVSNGSKDEINELLYDNKSGKEKKEKKTHQKFVWLSHAQRVECLKEMKRRTRVRVGTVTHVFFAVLDEWITAESIVLRWRHSWKQNQPHTHTNHELCCDLWSTKISCWNKPRRTSTTTTKTKTTKFVLWFRSND